MAKELTMTVKATELPIVKEYMEGIAAEMQALLTEIDRLERENEELRTLLLDWCTVPWKYRTSEMLHRTQQALKAKPE